MVTCRAWKSRVNERVYRAEVESVVGEERRPPLSWKV